MVTTSAVTPEELAAMPDDGFRYEVHRGVLVRMNPTGFKHLRVSGAFIRVMGEFVVRRGLGVVGGEAGFILDRDPNVVYAPDVVFVRADRLPPDDEQVGYLELAPDLVVEVVSPSDSASDVNDKVLVYLEAGVRLVWVADFRRRSVTVYAADRTARVLIEGDHLDGADVLPGFSVPIADLFA